MKGKIKNKKVTAVRSIKKAVFKTNYSQKVQNHASQPPNIAVNLLNFLYLLTPESYTSLPAIVE